MHVLVLLQSHLKGGVGPDEVGQVLAAEGGRSRAGQAGGDLVSHSCQELLRSNPSASGPIRSTAHCLQNATSSSATGHCHSP